MGLTGSFFTARRSFPFKKLLLSFQAIPLCIPSLIAILGYVSAFGMQGIFNSFLMKLFKLEEPPFNFLYSLKGLVFVQGFYNFPIILKSVHDSWRGGSTRLEKAARLLGAGEKRIFFTITLFRILPAICSSAIIVFLFCFFSFIIVLLFAPPLFSTLEVELYLCTKFLSSNQRALILALTESLTALLFVFLFAVLEQKGKKNRENTENKEELESIKGAPAIEKFFFVLYIFLITICFILPFLMIGIKAFFPLQSSFTITKFLWVIKRPAFCKSLLSSLYTGFFTGLLSTLLGFFTALSLFKNKNFSTAKVISFLPMTISSVLVGFIFLKIFRKGNPYTLIISQTVLYWPYAFRTCLNFLGKIPLSLLQAGELFTSGKAERLIRFYLPLEKRAVFASFFFCFALSIGDATLPLVLSIRGFSTLALDTMRYSSAYRFSEASASALILFLLTALLYFLKSLFEKKQKEGGR